MLSRLVETFANRLARRELARLEKQALSLPDMDLAEVKALGKRLRPRRRLLDQVISSVDRRLLVPLGGDPVARHPSTDWVWRPDVHLAPLRRKSMTGLTSGTSVTDKIKIFHDCRESDVSLRQTRNAKAQDYVPFGLSLEIYDFDGSFLSLAIDLPESVLQSLGTSHILQLDLALDSERQAELIARLNVKHGPNTAQMLREIPLSPEGAPNGATVEFDLAYAKIDERRIEKLWVDLIFGSVDMNRISLRDISVSRRLRSQL